LQVEERNLGLWQMYRQVGLLLGGRAVEKQMLINLYGNQKKRIEALLGLRER
jgi:hypothetical protein